MLSEKESQVLEAIKKLNDEMQAGFKGELDVSEFEPTADTLGTFTNKIPEREYLFYYEEAFGIKEGFLPSGEACMIGAPGGCGKTYLLMQAAIALACGDKWLDAKAACPMKVLFLGAEEKQEEMDRRAQAVAKSMGLYETPDKLNLVKKNLRVFGRVGHDDRIINKAGEPLDAYNKLKFFLEKNPDIKLVILDPAVDYFSGEEETDNVCAKLWVKLIAQLTMTAGKPTILVAHHTKKDSTESKVFKASEKESLPELSSDSFRGSSSIVQSFRWALRLARREYDDNTEQVFIRLTKTNYTKRSGVQRFEPDPNNGGILKYKKTQQGDTTTSEENFVIPPPPIDPFADQGKKYVDEEGYTPEDRELQKMMREIQDERC